MLQCVVTVLNCNRRSDTVIPIVFVFVFVKVRTLLGHSQIKQTKATEPEGGDTTALAWLHMVNFPVYAGVHCTCPWRDGQAEFVLGGW